MNPVSIVFAAKSYGQITIAFIREGTPTVANDSFTCTSSINETGLLMVDGCANLIVVMYNDYINNCHVAGSSTTGVGRPTSSKTAKLILSPNPVESELTVNYQILPTDKAQLSIIDNLGRIVKKIALGTDQTSRTIDLSKFQAGIYFYKYDINGISSKTGKFIVIR